jgi:hypothetical protein
MPEILIRLFDTLILSVMVAAYTSALIDFCREPKTEPGQMTLRPRRGWG